MNVYQALVAVASDIGVVGKDRKVTEGPARYQYRGIDDVIDAIHPALVARGVFIAPRVLDRAESSYQTKGGATWRHVVLTVEYELYGPDGDSVRLVAVGEGADNGDKATNKAMSAAFKTVMGQAFTIPFEQVDSEAYQVEVREPWWVLAGWQAEQEHDKCRDDLRARSRALPKDAAGELSTWVKAHVDNAMALTLAEYGEWLTTLEEMEQAG